MDPKGDVRKEEDVHAAPVQVEQKATMDEKELSKKRHLNVVFVGGVDAGKSPIGGQILSDQVDDRTIRKYEKEAKKKSGERWTPVSDRFKDKGIPTLSPWAFAIVFTFFIFGTWGIPAHQLRHYSADRASFVEFIGCIQIPDQLRAKLLDESICPSPSVSNSSYGDYVELCLWCNSPPDEPEPTPPGHSISRHNAVNITESVWESLFLREIGCCRVSSTPNILRQTAPISLTLLSRFGKVI